MPETQQSFIPVARRHSSIQSPANALALMSGPVDGAAPSSPKVAHTRNLSMALSSDGEGRRSPLTALRVSRTHSRLASAIEDIQLAALSPESMTLSLDGTDITDDDHSPADTVDRIRAPTRSSMNKQKKATPKNTPKRGRRRSMIPASTQADERLGLSRIPRASVTHALSLHPSTDASPPAVLPHPDIAPSTRGGGLNMSMNGSEIGSPRLPTDSHSPSTEPARLRDPLSPVVVQNTSRIPSGPHGKSTRMITTLQTELEHTKSHLDRVKQEVRNCRREIGTLTRRSEDLRETRDRQRGEMEALQNVISRKERMITEVLTRARTAEASITQNANDKKDLELRVKKAEADARVEIEAATAARQKAESECDALRNSVRSLREAWAREVAGYKEEVERVQTQMRDERDAAAKKHDAIMTVVKKQNAEHKNVIALVEEVKTQHEAAREMFDAQISTLRADAQRSAHESEEARNLAKTLAGELNRLRRLARQPPRTDLDAITSGEADADPTATPSHPFSVDVPAPATSSQVDDGAELAEPAQSQPAPPELELTDVARDADPTTPPDQE